MDSDIQERYPIIVIRIPLSTIRQRMLEISWGAIPREFESRRLRQKTTSFDRSLSFSISLRQRRNITKINRYVKVQIHTQNSKNIFFKFIRIFSD